MKLVFEIIGRSVLSILVLFSADYVILQLDPSLVDVVWYHPLSFVGLVVIIWCLLPLISRLFEIFNSR